MTKTLLFTTRKGGVGKTTLSTNQACLLALDDKKVLLIDIDPQGNIINSFGKNSMRVNKTILDLATKKAKFNEVVQTFKIKDKTIDILPCNINLTEYCDADRNNYETLFGVINSIIRSNKYDYIIIDTNPAWNDLIGYLMQIVDLICIPINPTMNSIYVLGDLWNTVKSIEEINHIQPKLLFIPNQFTIKHRKGEILQDRTYKLLEQLKEFKKKFAKSTIATPIKKSEQFENANCFNKLPIVCCNQKENKSFRPAIKQMKTLNEEILNLLK